MVTGCQKNQTVPRILDGAYSGEVIVTSPGTQAIVKNVDFNLNGGKYASIGGSQYITVGAGNFTINGQTLDFEGTENFPDNLSVVKLAVLGGNYTYSVKGDSLFLSANKNSDELFSYKLKKQ